MGQNGTIDAGKNHKMPPSVDTKSNDTDDAEEFESIISSDTDRDGTNNDTGGATKQDEISRQEDTGKDTVVQGSRASSRLKSVREQEQNKSPLTHNDSKKPAQFRTK